MSAPAGFVHRLVRPGSFTRNVLTLAGGTALGQGAALLASPVLTRLYTPAELGAFGAYAAIVATCAIVSSLRYEMAIPLPDDDDTANTLLFLSMALSAGAGIVAFGVFSFAECSGLTRWVPSLQGSGTWLIPLAIAATGWSQSLQSMAVRKRIFTAAARSRMLLNIGQVSGQVGLGFNQWGLGGLLVGDVFGRLASLLPLVAAGRGALVDWRLKVADFKSVFSQYVRFAKVMAPAALLNMAALQLPFLLVPSLFDATAGGLYFIAYRVLVTPASLIGGAVGQVFFSEATRLAGDPQGLRSSSMRLTLTLMAVNTPLYIGLAIASGQLFSWIFGPAWEPVGQLIRVMAPMILAWSVASPLSSLLVVGDRLKESLLFTALDLATKLVALLLGAYQASLMNAIWMLSITGTILSVASIARFLRVSHISLYELFIPFSKILVTMVPLAVALVVLVQLNMPWLSALCLVVLGGLSGSMAWAITAKEAA